VASPEAGRAAESAARRSPQWPSARSTVVGVIGAPVRHSLSPLLHNAAFDALGLDWVSVAFEVAPGEAGAALAGARALGVAGLSVTTPHKQDAAAAVDECSAEAARLGAVNCVTLRGGRLVGESTDGPGLLAAVRRRFRFDPAGRRCAVVGAGGAARAAVVALAGAGAAQVAVVNRDRRRAEAAAALAGAAGTVGGRRQLEAAELVVHATPVGMGDAEAIHPALAEVAFGPHQRVVDLVYHPARTALVERALAGGAEAANGLGMLVHQAALALEAWTGRAAPVEAMWAALAGAGAGVDPG
jgi:shikimate dehydrogenase